MSMIVASSTIEQLRSIFATHGLPSTIVSDNGPTFTSEELKMFTKFNGIKHIFSAPYHPASNGQAERYVRTIKEALKKLKDNGQGSLSTKLNRFLLAYRTTPNSVTKISPADMLFKRRIKTAFQLLKPEIELEVRRKQMDAEIQSGRKSPTRMFEEDDRVLVRNFVNGSKWMEGVVKSLL